jgi:RHS repeat-associated protein
LGTGEGSPIAGTYDALGRLVETDAGGDAAQFFFSPTGEKVAVVRDGALTKATIPLPGGETAVYNANGLEFIRHTDWLGSSRLGTTWAHAVYSKESYAPFGETYNEAGTPDRSFTGQDQDTVAGAGATGVYDFLFRKYDPAAGRWISPDPLGWGAVSQTDPQSLNRYAYVENDPLRLVDPDGLDCMYINDSGHCCPAIS